MLSFSRSDATPHAIASRQLGACALHADGLQAVLAQSAALGVACAALCCAAMARGAAAAAWLRSARARGAAPGAEVPPPPGRAAARALALSWALLLLAIALWGLSWRALRLASARCASCAAFPCARARTGWHLPRQRGDPLIPQNSSGERLCAAHPYCVSAGVAGGVAPYGYGLAAASVGALALVLQAPHALPQLLVVHDDDADDRAAQQSAPPFLSYKQLTAAAAARAWQPGALDAPLLPAAEGP
jgi:hypothetical protein